MKKKILVVDDEPDILTLVEKVLAHEAYTIFLARDGGELFEILKDNKPDIIILDVMMPDIDGFSICRRIKAEPTTGDIPVLMLTVLDSPEDVNRGMAAGATAFLTKPFDPDELSRKIKALLTQSARGQMG